jgi:hypothetical protein
MNDQKQMYCNDSKWSGQLEADAALLIADGNRASCVVSSQSYCSS